MIAEQVRPEMRCDEQAVGKAAADNDARARSGSSSKQSQRQRQLPAVRSRSDHSGKTISSLSAFGYSAAFRRFGSCFGNSWQARNPGDGHQFRPTLRRGPGLIGRTASLGQS